MMKNYYALNKALLLLVVGVSLISLSGCFLLVAGGVTQAALVLGDRRPVSVVTLDRGIQLEVDSLISQKI